MEWPAVQIVPTVGRNDGEWIHATTELSKRLAPALPRFAHLPLLLTRQQWATTDKTRLYHALWMLLCMFITL